MIRNIVPSKLQGNKTASPGKTPYEVLSFGSEADFDACTDEKDFKRFVVAKFATYGDATLYAHNLDTAPLKPAVILIRA